MHQKLRVRYSECNCTKIILLSRILRILNSDWLQHARSTRGVYELQAAHPSALKMQNKLLHLFVTNLWFNFFGIFHDMLWTFYSKAWHITMWYKKGLQYGHLQLPRKLLLKKTNYNLLSYTANSYSISHLMGTVTTQWLDSDSVAIVVKGIFSDSNNIF